MAYTFGQASKNQQAPATDAGGVGGTTGVYTFGMAAKSPPITPVVAEKPGFISRVAGTAKEEFKTTKEKLTVLGEEAAKEGNVSEKGITPARAAFEATGGFARVLFSPLTVGIGDLIEKVSDMPSVQKFAVSDSMKKVLDKVENLSVKLGDFAKDNPDLARDIQNIVDTVTLAVGPKVIKKPISSVASKFEQASETARVKLSRKPPDGGGGGGVASQFDQPAAEAFGRLGIEPPVSAISKSKAVQAAEATAQASWFGGEVAKTIESARASLFKISESLKRDVNVDVLKTGGVTTKSVGENLTGALDKVETTFNKTKTALYDAAEAKIPVTGQAVFDSTRRFLSSAIEQLKTSAAPQSAREAAYFEKILQNISTAQARSYKVIKATRTEIGKTLEKAKRGIPIEDADVGRLKGLYRSLSEDLDSTIVKYGGDSAKATLDEATAYYKAGKESLNSFVGRAIMNAKDPSNIFDSLIKAGRIDLVKELKVLLKNEPEAVHEVGKLFMNTILEKSINQLTQNLNPGKLITLMQRYGDDFIRELVGDKGLQQLKQLRRDSVANDILEKATVGDKLMPGQLARSIDRYSDTVLREVFSVDEYAKLMDLKTAANALARGTRIAEGSPTFEKSVSALRQTLAGGGVVGVFVVGPGALIPIVAQIAMEWGMSRAVTSKWFKNFVSGGKTGAEKAKTEGGGISGGSVPKTPAIGQNASKTGVSVTRYSEKPVEVDKKALQTVKTTKKITVVKNDEGATFVLQTIDSKGKIISKQSFSTRAEAESEL